MTTKEFTERTMVEVSNDEFEAINVVYMNSDLDKDEFCKMWCKMNATRVWNAKRELKAQREREAQRNILFKWFEGCHANEKKFRKDYFTPFAYTSPSDKMIRALAYFNITIEHYDTLSDIDFKVGKALGIYCVA